MKNPSEIHSMTGFSSVEGEAGGQKLRLEIRTLNHRFLDIKFRLLKEFASAEFPFRNLLQEIFARGTMDIKMDRVASAEMRETSTHPVQINLSLAEAYYDASSRIQKTLGLKESLQISDLLSLPGVMQQSVGELQSPEAWKILEPLAQKAIHELSLMRKHEGKALAKTLFEMLGILRTSHAFLEQRRHEVSQTYPAKIREKVELIFKLYPLADASVEGILESRISQELALHLDRTDIQEELVRFSGHLDHFEQVLKNGGPVGRKLEFILQELQREVNTLGNKAQDLLISEEVVRMKVCLEQLREQVMNLE